jgi:dTDP-glucose 4,6-dehydratase
MQNSRIKLLTYDISHEISDGIILEMGDINYIIHLAAETHVDNSILNPVPFVKNNINSTLYLLEYARTLKNLELFIYFSTDEVYGPALGDKSFKENEPHNSTNPYSASKSGCEQLCLAYKNTYNVPIIIVNSMNIFGERQHIEKFIPKVIKSVLDGTKIQIHCYPDMKTPGTRFYIHGRNVSAAILFVINKGTIGERYNITGEKEIDNLELAQFIASVVGKELKYELCYLCESRPGHDLRYSLDGSKLFNLGWKLPVDFQESLKKTILWTLDNRKWLE